MQPLVSLLNLLPRRVRAMAGAHTALATRASTHHSTYHISTFRTTFAKASFSWPNGHRNNDFRRRAGAASGGRVWCLVLSLVLPMATGAAEPGALDAQAKPFVEKFCVGCHNAKKDSGG